MLITLYVLAGLFVLLVAFVGFAGYFGPLKILSVLRIWLMYMFRPKGEIVFYGASNFFLWSKMGEDMRPLKVQNHGFGGSRDMDLMKRAKSLLYPYKPRAIAFQSGSNDFGADLTWEQICANKNKMYTMFREKLHVPFIVMSMLPLPGRAENWPDSQKINEYLSEYCRSHNGMVYVDATSALTTKDGEFRPELFRKDNIHLNRDGQKIWGAMIKKAIEGVLQDEQSKKTISR